MKMKKTLSLLLALVLSLGLLAGCGGDSNDQPAQNDTPQQEDTTTPPADDTASDAEPAPTEDVTIQVAALASGYEEAYPGMWQEVCDAFTTATGIKVDLIVDKALEDVIGPSCRAASSPTSSTWPPAVRRASPSSSSRTATSPISPMFSP